MATAMDELEQSFRQLAVSVPVKDSESSATEETFEILDSIYELTVEANETFKNAFIRLAKANYLSYKGGKGKSFGVDFYDYSDRDAVMVIDTVDTDNGLKLVDKMKINENKIRMHIMDTVNKESEPELENETGHKLKNRSAKELKEKKSKLNDDIEAKVAEHKKQLKKRNPIRMFNGGFVPRELSQAQEEFKKGLDLLVKLHNKKMQLASVAENIEEKKQTADKILEKPAEEASGSQAQINTERV